LRAAVSVEKTEGQTSFGIYPYRNLTGKLSAVDTDGNHVYSEDVELKASVAFSGQIDADLKEIRFNGLRLWSTDEQITDRPAKINPEFSLESAQGQMIHGIYLTGMRQYDKAEKKVDRALELDPVLLPALTLKSMLCLRKMEYEKAYEYAGKALAIDQYDPQANYISGQAAVRLGKVYDAMDRFEIAAITTELRSAAYTQLAFIYFREGDKETAAEYARKSLVGNAYNLTAYQILQQVAPSDANLAKIDQLSPLCHFADAERMLDGKLSSEAFRNGIFEEFYWQNYIEFAAFYHNLGLDEKAAAILESCPDKNALISLWQAYLKKDKAAIALAETQSVELVFPFRHESAEVLSWAVDNGGSWKSRYLYAMLSDFLGHKERALALLEENDADYAPYYAYRGLLSDSKEDMQKAAMLDPAQWRYGQHLAQMYYDSEDYTKAAEVAGEYFLKDKENFHIGDTYVKSLIALKQFKKADQVMSKLWILPFEGQSGSRAMYREIKVNLAADCMDRGKYKEAAKYLIEARQWPDRLGVGKPYDYLIDSTLENWMDAVLCQRTGDSAKAAEYMEIVSSSEDAEIWKQAFEDVTKKIAGAYPKVSPLLSSLPAQKKY
jgi:tetratricopeptide (TPR) repeat protein